MRLTMSIDGISHTVNSNPDRPLSQILLETDDLFPSNNACLGADCGNCIALLNGICVLSCLIPACILSGANIMTFEGFMKTRGYTDIEKAYATAASKPCKQCYAAKTLLIESILRKMEKSKSKVLFSRTFIRKEMSINKCSCLDSYQLEKIVKIAFQIRNKRSAGNV